ncbi:N-formylglutamate amidohydrolase [Acidocella sp.]|uniref:N-formylglutamate amidohydrolase n=1 Tax=Acidocella sp. TaxID=50710 RepID=UPI003CFDB3D8
MNAPPITLRRPARQKTAIVLTSPHSGRGYSPEFLKASRLNADTIRGSEDSFVDELFDFAPSLGLPLLVAEFPRAWCDANREPWELDPAMFTDSLPDYVNSSSPRVAAGLGTLARVVGTGEPIYARKLRFSEAKERIDQCWRPFHETLAGLIEESLGMFGHCLVLDCHSMPTPFSRFGGRPEIVLGDAHGTSCLAAWSNHIERLFQEQGFAVRRNDPYAGGFITRHYGRPCEGVQVMQIEIARGLYMNERQFTRKPSFEAVRRRLLAILQGVIEVEQAWGALGPSFNEAAE